MSAFFAPFTSRSNSRYCPQMTAFLPPNLLALFAAREPVKHLPFSVEGVSKGRRLKRKRAVVTGVAAYTPLFETPSTVDASQFTFVEKKAAKKERLRDEKAG